MILLPQTKKACQRQKNGKENVTTPNEARDSPTTKKDQTSDDPPPTKKVCRRQKSGKEILFHKHHVHVIFQLLFICVWPLSVLSVCWWCVAICRRKEKLNSDSSAHKEKPKCKAHLVTSTWYMYLICFVFLQLLQISFEWQNMVVMWQRSKIVRSTSESSGKGQKTDESGHVNAESKQSSGCVGGKKWPTRVCTCACIGVRLVCHC